MVLLILSEDDDTWVASNLSSAEIALKAEALELNNWILRFGCASEEICVEVSLLEDFMENSAPLGQHTYS